MTAFIARSAEPRDREVFERYPDEPVDAAQGRRRVRALRPAHRADRIVGPTQAGDGAGIIPAVPEIPVRLIEGDLDPEPVRQFETWFADAVAARIPQTEAAALATATPDGAPSVRMVLVKQVDARGFLVFTNYESRKGMELAANPRGALLFFWEPLGRQVRIEGSVERATRGGVRGLRPPPASGQSAQRAGLTAEPARRPRHDTRAARGRGCADQYGDGELPDAHALGRLPGRARALRVLAARGRPPARSTGVPAHRRRWVADRAPGAVGPAGRSRRWRPAAGLLRRHAPQPGRNGPSGRGAEHRYEVCPACSTPRAKPDTQGSRRESCPLWSASTAPGPRHPRPRSLHG